MASFIGHHGLRGATVGVCALPSSFPFPDERRSYTHGGKEARRTQTDENAEEILRQAWMGSGPRQLRATDVVRLSKDSGQRAPGEEGVKEWRRLFAEKAG